ncbi:MAG: hypothetical protein K8L99_09705 [Anaerolineae bacterium]|nr:hypothetical protein [Anaerolineae bacterium]
MLQAKTLRRVQKLQSESGDYRGKWRAVYRVLLLTLPIIAISGCTAEATPAASTQTATAAADAYVTEAQIQLRECPERACAVVSIVPPGVSLPVLTRHDVASDYWLEVQYEGQNRYVGPFIMVSVTYSSPIGAARACPSQHCPVLIQIPETDHILLLDVVVTNLVEHWTHTVYQGEEVYLGPWVPPPSNSVWSSTVIPASETARARLTQSPSTLTPAANPTEPNDG